MIKNGLKILPKDKRDFRLGSIFDAKLNIPLEDFLVANPKIKNQRGTFRCSGYATSSVLERQEGVELSPEYIYAKAKQIEGDVLDGANLRSVCKAVTKFGAIEASEFKETDIDDTEIKKWWSLQGYDYLAIRHRQKSYALVDDKYDFFDDIRSALYNQNKPVLTGTTWYDGWIGLEKIDKAIGNKSGGHALVVIGQKVIDGVPYLVVQNSYGDLVGDKGRHYFSREVINKYFKPYGGFVFIDLTKEEVLALLKDTTKSLLEKVLDIVKGLLKIEKDKMKTLLDIVTEKIGTDFTPDNIVPDKVSCAFSVSTILREYLGQKNINFPIIVSTLELLRYFQTRADLFQRVYEPQAGDICVSPTGTSPIPGVVGHTGIYIDTDKICSNSSATGLWSQNYTRLSWRKYFHESLQLPTYLYRLVV